MGTGHSVILCYHVNRGTQSGTIHSYISPIKAILALENYKWDENTALITTLAKACKIQNDKLSTTLPISCKLLALMLFEVDRAYSTFQPYLCILYKTILVIGYYGLFHLGELTAGGDQGSQHMIKACNVYVGKNKNKILVILYTLKTHGEETRPQKVKITTARGSDTRLFHCTFKLSQIYLAFRGGYTSID